ncbi:MAG: AtpZ/AtpI family protein [Anaerolineae bacterium]
MSEGKSGADEGTSRPGAQYILQPLALATQLGVTMGLLTVITAVGGLFLGLWIDRRLGTRPLATLILVLLGVLIGLLGTVNLARSAQRTLDAATAARVRPRTSFTARDLGRALLLIVELAAVTLVPIGITLWLGRILVPAAGGVPALTVVLAVLGALIALAGVYLVSRQAWGMNSREP